MTRVSGCRPAPMRDRVAAALAALLLLVPAGIVAESPPQREDRIKAALIFKLVKFVEWPAAALSGRDPLQICVLGSSAVGDSLASVDGKSARDRMAQVRKTDGLGAGELKGCHVLFIPSGARELGSALPTSLHRRGVLTVSDAPDFARRGGMIGITRSENKVGFEINLRNARDGGLEPGAPLLELATIVE